MTSLCQAKEKGELDEIHGRKGPWMGPRVRGLGLLSSSKYNGKPWKSSEQQSKRSRLNGLPTPHRLQQMAKLRLQLRPLDPGFLPMSDKEMKSLGDR